MQSQYPDPGSGSGWSGAYNTTSLLNVKKYKLLKYKIFMSPYFFCQFEIFVLQGLFFNGEILEMLCYVLAG